MPTTLIEFDTDRLRLRQWRESDGAPFAAMAADPRVMEFLLPLPTRADSDALIERVRIRIAENGWGLWAVEHKATGEFIGFTGLNVPVDAFATGAVAAIVESGRRIPDDVMVATRYDGVRARTSVPPLTAVDLHLEEVSQQAIALLFDHLRGDTATRRVDGPAAQLVPRLSSARRS